MSRNAEIVEYESRTKRARHQQICRKVCGQVANTSGKGRTHARRGRRKIRRIFCNNLSLGTGKTFSETGSIAAISRNCGTENRWWTFSSKIDFLTNTTKTIQYCTKTLPFKTIFNPLLKDFDCGLYYRSFCLLYDTEYAKIRSCTYGKLNNYQTQERIFCVQRRNKKRSGV